MPGPRVAAGRRAGALRSRRVRRGGAQQVEPDVQTAALRDLHPHAGAHTTEAGEHASAKTNEYLEITNNLISNCGAEYCTRISSS